MDDAVRAWIRARYAHLRGLRFSYEECFGRVPEHATGADEALMEAATGHRDIVDAARACGARMAPMDDVAAPEAPQAPQARRRAPRVRPADQG